MRNVMFVAAALLAILVLVGAARPQVYGTTIVLATVDGGTIPDASTVLGGMHYLPGTGLVVSNGTSWSAPGVTQATADDRYFMLNPEASYPNARQRSTIQWKVQGTGNTDFLVYGTTAVFSITGTAASDNTGTYSGISYTTTSSVNANAGPFTTEPRGTVEWAGRPLFAANVRTGPTSLQGTEWWLGLIEGTTFSAPQPQPGPNASSTQTIAIGYNDAQQPQFMCCASNGSNQSCTSTGVTPAINTDYNIIVDFTNASVLTCTVNGTSVTHSSTLPSSTSSNPAVTVRINNEGPADGGTKAFLLYDVTVTTK